MRVSKPIFIYLPTHFKSRLDDYIKLQTSKFKYTNDQFYYIIHYLITKHLKNPKMEYILLNDKNIKDVIGSNINRYIKILREGKFIISDKEGTPKVKSWWHKLNPNVKHDPIIEVRINPKSKLGKKIIKRLRLNKTHNNRKELFLRLMEDKFMLLDIDYVEAYNWVRNNAETSAKELSYRTSLKQLEDHRFRYFDRNKTNNRLDTNLTNLKSELKSFINGKYIQIDLKNSQPFLLGILINKLLLNDISTLCSLFSSSYLSKTFGAYRLRAISKIRQNQEKPKMANLSLYLNSVSKGVFYNEFINCYSENITRDEVKDIMFKVLFSKNVKGSGHKKFIPYEKEKIIFEKVYPLIYEIVKTLKSKDNKILPIYLQKLESYIFIDCIAKELTENCIIPLTIHDAIIIEPEHAEKALKIMNKVFLKEVGIVPSFDIKPLYKESKTCEVTKEDISMQKEDSSMLSHTGLKYLFTSDRKKYEEIKRKYLTKKWSSADFDIEIKEIAHNIRDTKRYQEIKQKRLYPSQQKQLFELNELQL